MSKTTRKPGGDRSALENAIRDLGRLRLQVGFFDTRQYPDGTPVAYVAAVQEFGHPGGGIPPRPFMRPALAQHKKEIVDELQRGSRAAMRGSLTVKQVLTQVGGAVAGHVQEAVTAITTPELSEGTLKARQSRKKTKGVSKKPLVDTGYLLASIDSQVVPK